MSWVMVGVGGLGAVKGIADARQNRKDQKAHDAYRREAIRMSPWTGMGDPGAGNFGNQNYLSAALGGGLQGAMTGGMLGKMGGAGAAAAAPSTGLSAGVGQEVMQNQMMQADPVQMMNQGVMQTGAYNPWQMMS